MGKLPQYGGEGKDAYKGTSSDKSLPQHGGEGKSTGKKSDMGLLNPKKMGTAYTGPGRNLTTVSN